MLDDATSASLARFSSWLALDGAAFATAFLPIGATLRMDAVTCDDANTVTITARQTWCAANTIADTLAPQAWHSSHTALRVFQQAPIFEAGILEGLSTIFGAIKQPRMRLWATFVRKRHTLDMHVKEPHNGRAHPATLFYAPYDGLEAALLAHLPPPIRRHQQARP